MGCPHSHDALSAHLDGDLEPAEHAAVAHHLTTCAQCRTWYERADTIGRLLRTTLSPASLSPGIAYGVLAAAPPRRDSWIAVGLRWVLGGLGVGQLLLGVTQIASLARQTHVHAEQVASAGHLWHESAAWNLAIGAAFLLISGRRVRPTGIVAVLSVFVAALILLSFGDVLTGRVQLTWLFSHGLLLAGYTVVVLLSRPRFHFGDPPTGNGRRWWSVHRSDLDDDASTAAPFASRGRMPGAPAARRRTAA